MNLLYQHHRTLNCKSKLFRDFQSVNVIIQKVYAVSIFVSLQNILQRQQSSATFSKVRYSDDLNCSRIERLFKISYLRQSLQMSETK